MADGMKKVMSVAVLKINTAIVDNYGCRWASDAMGKLAMRYDTACVLNETPLTIIVAINDPPYPLPADCIGGVKVYGEGGDVVTDYTINQRSQLVFACAGTYHVDYMKKPAVVQLLTDDPTIDVLYWDALGVYVAMAHLKSVGAEKDYQKELEEEFWSMASDVDTCIRKKKRTRHIPVRPWR